MLIPIILFYVGAVGSYLETRGSYKVCLFCLWMEWARYRNITGGKGSITKIKQYLGNPELQNQKYIYHFIKVYFQNKSILFHFSIT